MADKIKVYDIQGNVVSEFDIPSILISKDINSHIIYEQVLAENAANRQGTHSTLQKGEVRGGGRKPRPQKHTGGARQGSTRNPHWVGGGVAFGPKPNRNYKLYFNAKTNRIGLISAFNNALNQNAVFGLSNDVKIEKPSTKTFAKFISATPMYDRKVLVVSNDQNILKSARNINGIVAKTPNTVSVKDIINSNYLLFQLSTFDNLWKGGSQK